jgi:hypothetical protein
MEELCITNGTKLDCTNSKRRLSWREEKAWKTTQKMVRFALWRNKVHVAKKSSRRKEFTSLKRIHYIVTVAR